MSGADREALLAAVAAEREACARVAEARHEHWRMPHPDDAAPGEVCCDISACRDIAAAIRSRTDTASAPVGYVLVPREPTSAMWAAGGNAVVGYKQRHHDKVVADVWSGMLSAALSPATDAPGGGE